MAEGKKGFLLYADYLELFEELSDEDAGQLVKHIFKYVNDKDPETKNQLVRISFIPIKRQLKRDLYKYEDTKIIRSKAGKASAAARKLKKQQESTHVKSDQHNSTKPTHVKSDQHNSTKPTDSVSDNVTVNENENVINNWIDENCIGFEDELKLWISLIEEKYDNQTSIIQIESWLRLLNSWYKTSSQKKECLNKHIAASWKTINWVDMAKQDQAPKQKIYKDLSK